MKKFRIVAPLLAAFALTVVVAPAESAAEEFNLGTFVVDDDPNTGDIPLAIPAGDFNAYSLKTDWKALSGDPWSNEAILAITDGPLSDPGTTFFADPGPSPVSADNGDPVTLTWDGFLDVTTDSMWTGPLLTARFRRTPSTRLRSTSPSPSHRHSASSRFWVWP